MVGLVYERFSISNRILQQAEAAFYTMIENMALWTKQNKVDMHTHKNIQIIPIATITHSCLSFCKWEIESNTFLYFFVDNCQEIHESRLWLLWEVLFCVCVCVCVCVCQTQRLKFYSLSNWRVFVNRQSTCHSSLLPSWFNQKGRFVREVEISTFWFNFSLVQSFDS